MPDNPDQPPASAIPLSEFFKMAEPRLRAAQEQAEERLNVAKAAISPVRPTLRESRTAHNPWYDSPEVQAANEAFQQAARAVTDELHNRLLNGEWLAWGRKDSPVGPWQLLPAGAWRYLKIHAEHSHPMEDLSTFATSAGGCLSNGGESVEQRRRG